jgi:hypothetical protein
MNNEFKRIWQEVSWPNLRNCSDICPEGLRKTTKVSLRVVSLWTKTLTWNLPNTRQKSKTFDDVTYWIQIHIDLLWGQEEKQKVLDRN